MFREDDNYIGKLVGNTGQPDKLTIARRVVEELPEDGVIVLDSGSLTFFCAQAMPTDRSLVVVTNNLPAAQYLADFENLRVFTLPGMIRGLTSAAVDASMTLS